jgi:RNA polymerase sigma-70 factor, ECF subfamily
MDDNRASPPVERFERLYTAHYASVLAYALRRAPRAEADDVVAETFTIAWRRLADVPADPRPWLYEVARRVLANRRRTDARREALLDRLRHAPAIAPDDPVDLESLATVFTALPEHEREALALVAWEGLATRDAARAAGCSGAAMRVRLHRARRRLRRALDASGRPAMHPSNRMELR